MWLVVDQFKRRINTLGPPGGASATAPLTLQFETLLSRVAPAPPLVVGEYRRMPPPDEHRVLADDLVARGIQYGSANYADAYITDFFARERVILNSTEKVRIGAYEADVTRHAQTAVRVVRQPCGSGRPVASWCILDPLNR